MTFVHATDPHLFEAAGNAAVHEPLNRKAFERLLDTLDALPGSDAAPAFLLVTGDFGIGEAEGTGEATRQRRIERLAAMLARRPGLEVYWVPGNNDVPKGSAAGAKEANAFLAEVQALLGPAGVKLHDLTACYLDAPVLGSGCTADVAGTRFRLVGFPTHSFKAAEPAKDCPVAAATDPQTGGAGGTATPDPTAAPTATAADPTATPTPADPDAAAADAAAGAPAADATAAPIPPPAADAAAASIASPAGTAAGAAAARGSAGSAASGDAAALQAAWMGKLARLVEEARRDGQRVLLATHVPDLNDPFVQASGEACGAAPGTFVAGRPPWSAWGVGPELLARWREIVDSPTVDHVLAGHFHDTHREVYQEPYAWERQPLGAPLVARPDRGKIWIAPPLAVRLQDVSPLQARGFALVELAGGESSRRLFWYDGARGAFAPEAAPRIAARRAEPPRGGKSRGVGAWLWDLGTDAEQVGSRAVLLIAMMAAFLTVVAVWRIPPTQTLLKRNSPEDGGANAAPANADATAGAFDNNFSRAVLAGFAGMISITFLGTLWKDPKAERTTQYVVWFILFFLAFLVLSAALRAFAEVLRSRIVASQRRNFASSGSGWRLRLWRWTLSLRSASLVWFDVFFNVLQGKNDLQPAVLGETILYLQKSLVATVDRLAVEIQKALLQALRREDDTVEARDVRVNISVMADDAKSLSYVSLRPGSLQTTFRQRSVAWVASTVGEARWWKDVYPAKDVQLYDNQAGVIAGWEPAVTLASCFQPRETLDYEAFVVIPIPWFRGARGRRKGAVHISFAKRRYLDHLWENLEDAQDKPDYRRHRGLLMPCASNDEIESPPAARPLCIRDAELCALLSQAFNVLPEVLAEFNPPLFEDLIQPR